MISICLILLIVSTTILSGYYLFIFARLRNARNIEFNGVEPVSVIICARNEEENLRKNLNSILEQDHPNFEVVVINDASWDGTGEYLTDLQRIHSNLEVVTITENQKRSEGKKMALTLGFKKAKYNRFLLIDADCYPRTNRWISGMTHLDSKPISLGYGAYEKNRGLLNLLVRFDTWSIGVFYLSAAASGKPYMGVGRNLSYTRSIYDACGGFKNHYHLVSGDDDLFVNQNATRANTQIVTHPDTHTISSAPETWKSWLNQKKRHLSVGGYYKTGSKWFIGVYQISLLIFYGSILGCVLERTAISTLIIAFSIKTIIHLLISIYSSKELKENDMVVLLPILEPLMLVLNLFFGLATLIRRTKAWK